MKRFRDQPISRKLSILITAITAAGLLFSYGLFATNEVVSYHQETLTRIETVVKITAANSAAALAFDDKKAAGEILASLQADERAVLAVVYDKQGAPFSVWQAPHAAHRVAAPNNAQAAWQQSKKSLSLWGREVSLMKEIELDRQIVGAIYLTADLSEVWYNIFVELSITGVSLLVILLMAFLISLKLQGIISKPVLELVRLAKKISRDKDYTLRAAQHGNDELGMLAEGFNEMLEEIRLRDAKLRLHNEQLEYQVQTRTAELSESNFSLVQAVREIKLAKQAAEAASATKSQFLANMSHEIRTPMNGVLGMAELLLETDLNEQQKHFARTVQSSATALLEIINDILDFSKIEAGKLKLAHTDFSLNKLIAEISELFTEMAHKKGLAFSCRVDDAMPDCLRGDPGRLRQVLTNLIGNALKFTEQGSVNVDIKCLASSPAETSGNDTLVLYFAVTDTGIGINDEQQTRLFQAFTQADGSTTRRFGGTGLGLAISKQLVNLMQGNIGVNSGAGRGSTFWFTARFETGSTTQPAEIAARAEPPAAAHRPFAGRVLLAEDNRVNQQVALAILQRLGIGADLAANGREALHAARQDCYDLILMDCQMPEMDGFAATAEIRREERHSGRRTIIAALTANAMEGDRERCLAAGFDDYLSKPFSKEQLHELLARWLPPTPQNPIDNAILDDIRALQLEGEPDVLHEIITLFCDDAPQQLELMEKLLERNDGQTLALAAHRLKSSCAMIGAQRLNELCIRLEALGCANLILEARALLKEIAAEYQRVEQALRQVLAPSLSKA